MIDNPYKTWDRYNGVDQLLSLAREDYKRLKEAKYPFLTGGDTETTGLHIIFDKPFLGIFGWLLPEKGRGRVFTFEPTKENVDLVYSIAKVSKLFVFHNAKFDKHMFTNIDMPYLYKNICDNTAIARLGLEAIPAREGGDKLDLKSLGVKYVHPDAAKSEEMVKAELQKLNDQRIKVLTSLLKQFPLEGETTPSGKQKYWGKGAIEKFLKDPTNDIEDLPNDIREVWEGWNEAYPEPSYKSVSRETMDEYAADDVITMLEFVRKFLPIVKHREQLNILKKEMEVMHPIFKMERVGMPTDQGYLKRSRQLMKSEITKKRREMYALVGYKVDCNQHKEIQKVFKKKWNIALANVDKTALKRVKEKYNGDISRYARIISELRTLEKWYSTYILRIIEKSKHDGRFYTQINLSGAVSGRMSCDAQQFPKGRILTDAGKTYESEHGEGSAPETEEYVIFNPRRAFKTSIGQGYKYTYYLDFSQIELRNQAHWTILVSGGDTNLCRAYMPFKCHRISALTGKKIPYDFKDTLSRLEWDIFDWYLDEDPKTKWTPTDVHSETTHNALELLGYKCLKKYEHYVFQGGGKGYFGHELDKKGFKNVRKKGKTANFAKNYGSGAPNLSESLEVPLEVAEALVQGYDRAFPHVIAYQKAISIAHRKKGYVQNHYGRRYYLRDTRKSYKLGNYNVQGTSADLLKECIIEIDKLLVKNNYKTRMVIPIHDEVQFDVPEGEEHVIPQIKAIMENHPWHLVPVIADIERTETYWSEKEDVD